MSQDDQTPAYQAYHREREQEQDALAAQRVEQSLGIGLPSVQLTPEELDIDAQARAAERRQLPSEREAAGDPARGAQPVGQDVPPVTTLDVARKYGVVIDPKTGMQRGQRPPTAGQARELAATQPRPVKQPARPIPDDVASRIGTAVKDLTGFTPEQWAEAFYKPEHARAMTDKLVQSGLDLSTNAAVTALRDTMTRTLGDIMSPEEIGRIALYAGLAIGAVTDPLNVVPGGGAAKATMAVERGRAARALGEAVRQGTGITYDLKMGTVHLKKGQSAWSIRGAERVFDHAPSTAELHTWLMALPGDPQVVGLWEQNGKWYADISKIGTPEQARIGGKAERQRAIYHGGTPEEGGGEELLKYAPTEEGPTIRLEHYSNRPIEGDIDPARYGQAGGHAGRERARLTEEGFLPRSYYYDAGTVPEARFLKAPYKSTVEVSEHRIYDINTDPEGIYQAAGGGTAGEAAVRARGYAGFRNTSEFATTKPGTVALFEPATPIPTEAAREPIRVLHGTGTTYDKVDLAKLGDEGFWVAEDPGTADVFARGRAPQVRPYILLPDAKIGTRDDWMAAVERQGVDPKRVRDDLRAQGFDAIRHEGYGGEPGTRYQVLNLDKLIEPFSGRTAALVAQAGAGAAIGTALSDDDDPYAGTALAGLAAGLTRKKPKPWGSAGDRLRLLKTIDDFTAPGEKILTALRDVGVGKMVVLGATSKKAFREAMVAEFGDTLLPHIDALHAATREQLSGRYSQLKGKTTTLQQALAPWHAAEGRPNWYGARKAIQQLVGPDADLMAGLVAATSAGMNVTDNIEAALDAYRIIKTLPRSEWRAALEASPPIRMGHGAMGKIENIFRAVDGQPLHGNKVNDFHAALLGREEPFTVDRHVIRIAFKNLNEKTLKRLIAGIDDTTYAIIAEWGKNLAAQMGTTPTYAQQRLWVGHRILLELETGNAPLWPTLVARAKELGIDRLVPKSPLLGEEGRVHVGALLTLASAATGGLTGATFGETPIERVQNALLGVAGGAIAPGVALRAAKVAVNHAPALRSLLKHGKDPNAWPPEVQARMDALLNAYEYELQVEEARRGVRPLAQAHAEAAEMLTAPQRPKQSIVEQLIRGGRMSLDEVRGLYPGVSFNDAEAIALVRVVAQQGETVQQRAHDLMEVVKAGGSLTPADVQGLLTELFTVRELLPRQAGGVAEAGRTLNAMNDPTSGWNQYLRQWHALFSNPASGLTPERLAKVVSEFKDPSQLAKVAQATTEPGWADIAIELLYGSMLGNPTTPTVNSLMGLATLAYMPAERAATVLAGTSAHWLEPLAQMWGATQAFPKALAAAGHALMTGERVGGGVGKVETRFGAAMTPQNLQRLMGLDPEAYGTMFGRVADAVAGGFMGAATGGSIGFVEGGDEGAQIGGAIGAAAGAVIGGGRIARAGTRLMLSADELYRTMIFDAELWAQAVRKGFTETDPKRRAATIHKTLAHPTAVSMENAQHLANEFTFNAPLGPTGQKVVEGISLLPGPYRVLAKMMVPFISTPVNLFKFDARRTPGLQMLHASWLNDLNTPGIRHDTAAAQLALGSAFAAALIPWVLDGGITGPGPADPNVKREWLAEGNQEYSVRFGDTNIGLNLMDPHGMYISLVATWAAIADHLDSAENEQIAMALVMAPARTMLSKTYMQSANDVLNAFMERDPNKAYHFLQQKTSLAVPSFVRVARRVDDPYLREVKTLLDAAQNRVPGLSRDLPPQRNVFAKPMPSHEPIGYGLDWVAPFRMKTVERDDASRAVIENRISVAMPGYAIYGTAEKQFTLDPQRESVGVPLTPQLRDELIRRIGEPLHKEWTKYVQSDAYRKASAGPDGERAYVFHKLYSAYREAGVAELIHDHPDLMTKYELILERRAKALEGTE